MTTVLVTGATDGIGRETARELVRRGARVIVHGRTRAKIDEVAQELAALGRGAQPEPVQADFASLDDVRRMARALLDRSERIDVLLNNAGIYANELRTTKEGFEATFGVNHLAPFLLTHLLLPALRASGDARVVNVSSVAHNRGDLGPEDLERLGTTAGFEPYKAYAASKLANVLFTIELARRLGPSPVVHALHPGVVSTKLLTEGFGVRGSDSHADGAATSVMLALGPEAARVTGRYWSRAREEAPSAKAQRSAFASAFYLRSCELVSVEPVGAPD